MNFKPWLVNSRDILVRALTTADVRTTLRNYLTSTFMAGIVVGAILAGLWTGFALIAAIIFGSVIGYAMRSYVSHQRREAVRRRRALE